MNTFRKNTLSFIQSIEPYIFGISLFVFIIIFNKNLKDVYITPKLVTLQIGLAILIFLTISKTLINNKRIVILLPLLLILLFISQIAGFIFSESKITSFWGAYGTEGVSVLLFCIALLFGIIYTSLKNKQIVQTFILLGTYFSSFYGLYSYFILQIIRPPGLEGHPIWSASLSALGIFLVIKIKNKYTRFLFLIPHLLALYIFDSTVVWIAVLSTFIIYILSRLRKNSFRIIFFVVCAAVFLFIGSFLISKEQYSIQKRLQEYSTVFNLVKSQIHSPIQFFVGYGQNTSGFYLSRFFEPKIVNDKEQFMRTALVHNQFIETFLSTGLFGLIIWILLLRNALKISFKKSSHNGVLILYLIVLQFFYFLPLPIYTIAMIYFISSVTDNLLGLCIPISNGVKKTIVIIILIIVATALLINTYIQLRSEQLYSDGDYSSALMINNHNDNYYLEYSLSLLNSIEYCRDHTLTKEEERDYWNRSIAFLSTTNITYENQNPQPLLRCTQKHIDYEINRLISSSQTAVTLNKLHPNNWSVYATGLFYSYTFSSLPKQGKKLLLIKAQQAARKAYEIDPSDAMYADNVGLLYFEGGQYQEAEIYFKRSIELDRLYNPSYFHLRDTYEKIGNKDKKIEVDNTIKTLK